MNGLDRADREMRERAKLQERESKNATEKLRLKLLSRGVGAIKGFGKVFRIMDDDGNRSLSLREFRKGMRDYGIVMEPQESQEVFDAISKDGSDSIEFDEFLVAIRPPLRETRVNLITDAFKKLDKDSDGVVTVDDIRHTFNVRQHPKYQNGDMDEDEVLKEFLKQFEADEADGRVTYEEFYNYYVGVSASIDNDIYFGIMMKTCWKL